MNMKTVFTGFVTTLAVAALPAIASAGTVYVATGSGNAVVGVDTQTHRITATYPDIPNPHGLALADHGEYLVAGSLAEQDGKSQLYLIHPVHGHVMSTVTVDGWTHHQTATPDGRYVISTHPTRNAVSLLDVQTNSLAATLPSGRSPNYTVVSADGSRAYVSNSGEASITEIDLVERRPLRTLQAGPVPEHMVMGPKGRNLYVANVRAGTVSEVNLDSGKIDRRFEVGEKLHGLDLSDDGRRLFTTTRKQEQVVMIELDTGAQRSLALSPDPYHVETIEGTGQVYVSSRKAPVIWVIDQASFQVVDRFELPAGEGHQMVVVED